MPNSIVSTCTTQDLTLIFGPDTISDNDVHDTRSDPKLGDSKEADGEQLAGRVRHAAEAIPSGTKLPVTLTGRERGLIRDETLCDPDFAKCAVVEGTRIRVELSLDEIEEIQGYVAAEANHTTNSKRRKELDRLVAKLQVFLDTSDDQNK